MSNGYHAASPQGLPMLNMLGFAIALAASASVHCRSAPVKDDMPFLFSAQGSGNDCINFYHGPRRRMLGLQQKEDMALSGWIVSETPCRRSEAIGVCSLPPGEYSTSEALIYTRAGEDYWSGHCPDRGGVYRRLKEPPRPASTVLAL